MSNRKLHVSEAGLRFIETFEGLPNGGRPYNDPVGHCTVGYGHLIHTGNCTQADRNKWGSLTQKQATDLLKKDIVRYEDMVKNSVKVKLEQHEFDAIVSAVYNLGPIFVTPGQSTFLALLNEGKKKEAAEQFVRWDMAGGHEMAGLKRRRLSERDMFLNADYTTRPT
jgi:lysozyme